jgi:predicted nucleic acid-binding protein
VTYLVDANTLSEPTRSSPDQRVIHWLREHEPELTIDAIILGEIRYGVHLLPASSRRRRLERWFGEGVAIMTCLPWDATIGLRWAQLLADLRVAGRAMPVKDSLIAATALTHDLVLVTRNTRDFQNAGVKLLNPFT